MAAPTCLAPRHPVVALARRLEIPASDHVFEAALSFVDVDQVAMTVTNVSLLTAKPCSNSCASFLRLFRLPRLIPRWPQPLSSIGLQALVAPFGRIPVAPLDGAPVFLHADHGPAEARRPSPATTARPSQFQGNETTRREIFRTAVRAGRRVS